MGRVECGVDGWNKEMDECRMHRHHTQTDLDAVADAEIVALLHGVREGVGGAAGLDPQGPYGWY